MPVTNFSVYLIKDELVVEMARQGAAYATLNERFSLLVDRSMSRDEVAYRARTLVNIYPSDLEQVFTDEFLSFSCMYSEK